MVRLRVILATLALAAAAAPASAAADEPCDPAQPGVISDPDGDGQVTGTEGNDVICLVVAPSSADYVVEALGGDDIVYGGRAQMDVDGGAGDDRIDPGFAYGTRVRGGEGLDELTFARFANPRGVTVSLRAGHYIFYRGSSRDSGSIPDRDFERVQGSPFDDEIVGGDGSERLAGGAGDDRLDGGLGSDTLVGQDGSDWAVYRDEHGGRIPPLTITLDSTRNDGGFAENDLVTSSVENVEILASEGADLTGDAGPNRLVGGGGAERLSGAGGDDLLDGGGGPDVHVGGAGTDTVLYADRPPYRSGPVTASLDGMANDGAPGEGDDAGGEDVENLASDEEPVDFTGNDGPNLLQGDKDSDRLAGGGGDDRLLGSGFVGQHDSDGADVLIGGDGDDHLDGGGGGDDDLDGGEGDDRLAGNSDDDTLNGGAGADDLDGGENAWGNDHFTGGAGPDTFTDGGGTDTLSYADHTAGVTVDLADPAAPQGSPGEGDSIAGATFENVVGGAGGDDIRGDGADNVIDGGPGPDALSGGEGRDLVTYAARTAPVTVTIDDQPDDGEAGEGDDVRTSVEDLAGGEAGDRLDGSALPNRLAGNNGDDVLIGRAGDDELQPGFGDDTLLGNEGADAASYAGRLIGVSASIDGVRNDGSGDERDFIRDDVENLIGGNGDDTLTGGAGANVLEGGPGADTFNGGGGSDTASYERHVSYTSGVDVSLDGTRNDGLPGENDLVGTDVENVTGSRLFDVLLGDDGANVLRGGLQSDVLDGGLGPDVLLGGTDGHNDLVRYSGRSEGVNVSLDGVANDGSALDEGPGGERDLVDEVLTVVGGAGPDVLRGYASDNTNLYGGPGNDELYGGSEPDSLVGEADADVLDGGLGDDALTGGSGADTVSYAGRQSAVTVELGRPTNADPPPHGGAAGEKDRYFGIEHATGGEGDDTITGDGLANDLAGGPGGDLLRGMAGDDVLRGEDGDDRLVGLEGADTYSGGGGVDRVNYQQSPSGVRVTLDDAPNDGTSRERDDVRSDVEDVLGSAFRDDVRLNGAANRFEGNDGNDLFDGGAGPDVFVGGAGVDVMTYANRTEPAVVTLGTGADDGEAGEGDDVTKTVENVIGGTGPDRVVGTSAANLFDGRDGDDVFDGRLGSDTFYGGAGRDLADYGARSAQVVVRLDASRNDGQAGERDYVRGSDVEDVLTGNGPDRIFASPLRNILTSGAGDDIIYGADGGDRGDSLLCGAGFDRFTADPTDRPDAGCESPL